jgi:hypothetical protein
MPDCRRRQPAGSAHGGAVKSVRRAANHTDLVVLPLGACVWPRKLMSAKHFRESLKQWWSHAVLFPCFDEVIVMCRVDCGRLFA